MYLARSWQRQFDQLGAQCMFKGWLNLTFPNHDPSQLSGRIAGEVFNIQLDKITGASGNGLRGSCDLDDFVCDIDEGRIESANLQVASNGAISVDQSWVDMIQHFSGANGNDGGAERMSLPQVNPRVNPKLLRQNMTSYSKLLKNTKYSYLTYI